MKNYDDAALTGREEMVMKCIWDHQEPISAVETQQALKDKYDLSFERPTITTFIVHLRDKGFLGCYKKGQIYYYYPLVTEEAYTAQRAKQFTDFWFHGSAAKFLRALSGAEQNNITSEELDEIQKIIDGLDE